MNFERGKLPKDALNIGERALALNIVGISKICREEDFGYKWDRQYVSGIIKKYYGIREDPETCHTILSGISAAEINPIEWAAVCWEKANINPTTDLRIIPMEYYEDFEDLLGKYVRYENELYKIPTYDEFRKTQEAWRRARSRGMGLSSYC